MNSLIVYPLFILIFLGAFNQLLLTTDIDFTYNETLEAQQARGNQSITGEEDELIQETSEAEININMITGIIALIIGLIAVGVMAGVKVLGSGLDTFSVKLIFLSAVYYGLWGIFSALAFTVFLSIPFFGVFIWFILTLIYSLGFFKTVEG